jgi:protein-S-isoprenylcysteine O-methyltransferase Ste14
VWAQNVLMFAVLASALVSVGPEWVSLIVGALLGGAGIAFIVGGALALGSALSPFPRPRPGAGLREIGLFGRVRHPIYGGVILLAAGWSTYWLTPVGGALTLVLAVVLDLKARREESWLEERYPEYASYRLRVPRRFLPWLY